jgi:hypothetical protein
MFSEPKKRAYKLTQYSFKCYYCKSQTSVLANTVFQDTPYKLIPLWFRAIWYVTSERHGTSASALQKFLGLGTYRTAWTWLKKLRGVMIPEDKKLQGTVILDEFYIGKKDRYGSLEEKFTVLIALEIDKKNNSVGHIRMLGMDYYEGGTASQNVEFIKNNISTTNTILLSNGRIELTGLPESDYHLEIVEKKRGEENYKPVSDVISYLTEKKLLGTLSSVCADKHISNYLNECCFKFNNRSSKNNWFYELLHSAVHSPPTLYKEIIAEE